jgi:hypothetical protein
LHTCLGVTPAGDVLGVLDQRAWVRPLPQLGRRAKRHQSPIEQKESQRWLTGLQATAKVLADHPQAIVVGDREADIYELFAADRPEQVHLVVRVRHESRRVDHAAKTLLASLQAGPIQGELRVSIPRKQSRPAREACLSTRWQRLELYPPRGKGLLPAVSLTFVLVEELSPPAGEKPVRWLLATTVPIENLESASGCVGWYVRRWLIEQFHYTLKSGCQVEQRALGCFDNHCRAIACLSIVAWRLLWLMSLARQHPDEPCSLVLSEPEWQALEAYAQHRFKRPARGRPPSLDEATRLIGRLGGHLGRKGDGPPGVKTLWRGLTRLSDITIGWLIPRSAADASHEDCG